MSLAIVDASIASDASLFLSKALSIGTTPAFQVDVDVDLARRARARSTSAQSSS